MTMPRNFTDELAALVDPAPQAELDPEAVAITEGDHLGGSDDELAGLVAGTAANRRAIPADITLEGGQYTGRRSSRAALFGDQQQDSGDEPDTSDSEGALMPAPVTQQQQRPFIDYATIPTMFVNGHINHGPGPDDTTSTSTLGDSDEQQYDDEQDDQQQQHVQTLGTAVASGANHQQVGSVQVDTMQEDQQQQQQQQQRRRQQQPGATAQQPGSSPEQQLGDQLGPDGAHSAEAASQHQHNEQNAVSPSQQQQHQQQQQSDSSDEEFALRSEHEVKAAAISGGGGPDAAGAVAAMLGDDAEMQELEREAAAAEAEAAEQLVAAAAHSSKDAAKAAGVRAQQRLWGAALEMRIRLQKAVSGANVLPRPEAAIALKAADKQIVSGYSSLLSACQSTLEDMLHLHNTLAQQHPAAAAALAAAQAAHANTSKRSRETAGLADDSQPPNKFAGRCSTAAAAWRAVDGAIDSLAGFRDSSLDKWHRRTVLSSGTAALRGSSGLRALQQSVSRQVSSLMSEQHKLIKRSQLPRQLAPRPLGQPAAAAAASASGDSEDEGRAAAAGDRDPETYDEGDFYQQLLKELIDSAPGGNLGAQLAAARPAKRRKVVDRRASKGRKLRYHTLDKLVGFMAPTQLTTPPFAEQLFANLFTHQG